MCLHAERKRCDTVLANELRVDKRDCERTRVQVVHNRVALNNSNASTDSEVRGKRTTQWKRGKSRTVAMNASKLKQAESWQLEKCDVRIKFWKARVIQSGALGATRECLSKLVPRLKHDRTDDDAEDERNEEDLCDCFLPQYIVSPGTSPTMRRTKCEVRRDSCNIVSFKTVRRREVQTSSQVMCDSCRRAVSAVEGRWLSDSDQSHFKQEQLLCAGCWMMAGIELNVGSLMCKKLGQFQTDCSVVQGVMVETWKYEDEDYVFKIGHEVSVQRRQRHNCTGGASRSACRFGRVSELTLKSTTSPKSPGSCQECFEFGTEMGHRLRSLVRMTTIRVDRRDRCFNLQEFHCWLNKRSLERVGSNQTGESRSRANRL